jgi:hypothetical protein
VEAARRVGEAGRLLTCGGSTAPRPPGPHLDRGAYAAVARSTKSETQNERASRDRALIAEALSWEDEVKMNAKKLWDAPDLVPALTYSDLLPTVEWLERVFRFRGAPAVAPVVARGWHDLD